MIRTAALALVCIVAAVLPLVFYYDGGLYLYSPAKTAMLAAAGAVMLALVFLERWRSSRRLAPPDAAEWLLVVFLVWSGLAMTAAANVHVALGWWLQWAAGVAAFWIVRRSDNRGAALGAVALGAVLTAAIGYAQRLGYGPPAAADQYGEVLPTAAFGHANFAAQAVLPAVVGGAAALLAARGRLAAAAGAALVAAGLPFLLQTSSRGAWLAAAAGLALTLAVMLLKPWGLRRRALAGLAVSLALAAGLVAARPQTADRIRDALNAQSPATAVRLAVWNDAFPLIFKVPVFGFGPGQFLYRFPEFWSEETAKRVFTGGPHLVENPHNDWLAFALDAGWPAVVALGAALLLVLFRRMRGAWAREAPPPGELAAFAAVAAWAIYGLVDYPLHNPYPWFSLMVLLGYLAPLVPSDDTGRRGGRWAALGLAAAALVLAVRTVPALVRAAPAQSRALQGSQYLGVDPGHAFRLALEAVELDEHNALGFSVLGQSKLAAKPAQGERVDYEGAEYFLKRALELYPDDFVTRYNLGVANYERALEREEGYERARSDFMTALEINPYYGKAYFQLGSIAARDGLAWPQVRRQLDRAVKLEPPLLLAAMQAPEFAPYRSTPEFSAWADGLRRSLNIRTLR